ncbi:MAG TPA: hypothetical protein DCS07_02440 [Bdellovibrionales bacterium]|nr:MAG: hypothetical protein A2Z97_01705 [Bdellovibrionales bacterium GWB1_52_6]OFZ04934.1 MAG: hypothetical protein A2X97_16365 [Bdellovibrionales bacterium GWA1_52_35]OFZ34620.1 MAG: hypothetical protein A2070_11485 [Bdellovibrionales bacterium GWC1_52_8]HAR41483.1 hypothetical protein [Bdellovibrionales bacterium]
MREQFLRLRKRSGQPGIGITHRLDLSIDREVSAYVLREGDVNHAMSGIGNQQLDLVPEHHEISGRLRDIVNFDFLKAGTVLGKCIEDAGVLVKLLPELRKKPDRAFFN